MNSDNSIKLAFLLGSGISIPAEMPSTQKITEQVLSGEDIRKNSDDTYSFGPSLHSHVGIPDEYVPRILIFLNRLKVEIDLYYFCETERFTNYEDLYYVTGQIHDTVLRNYDNPAVQPFINKILSDIRPLLRHKEYDNKHHWRLHELADETMNYISDIVWHLLDKVPIQIDYLKNLCEACKDSEVSRVDIFTLNHDTVLEQSFAKNGIKTIDGFGEPRYNVRYWDPDLFEKENTGVRLFKLHGSVKWFRLGISNGNYVSESIGIPLEDDIEHTKSPQDKMQWLIDGRPLLLIGTFNKMLRYTSGIYAELYYQLLRSLRHAKRLVVCGYGFGDKGINNQIVEWINSSSEHKVTIVDPKPEKLKRTARFAISSKWDEWINDDKLIIISKGIEETSWQDIRSRLFP